MKKTLLLITLSAVAGFSCLAQAATKSKTDVAQFCLYSKKSLSSPCKKQKITTPLVTIVRDKGWAKVGLRDKEGTVGWVNMAQYQKARSQFNQPNIQTVYVTTSQDKNGKQTYNVVAYRNGQPVSKEEAQKLYQQLRRNQQSEVRGMDRMARMMNRMMRWDTNNMDRVMRDAFPNFAPGQELPQINLESSDTAS